MNNDYCEFTVYVKRPGVDKLMFADYLSSGGQVSLSNNLVLNQQYWLLQGLRDSQTYKQIR